jgi:hypothetical protein
VTNLVDTIKLQRPSFDAESGVTGRVGRDDRGNAVWQWADEIADVAIGNTGLSVTDEPPPPGSLKINKLAARVGYNPYESGLIERRPVGRKRDLRELSKWIELRRQRGEDTKV